MELVITYLLLILPKMASFLGFIGGVVLFLIASSLLISYMAECSDEIPWSKVKQYTLVGILMVGLSGLIPQKEDMLILAGVYVGKEIVQSDTGTKAIQLINKQLDELLATE